MLASGTYRSALELPRFDQLYPAYLTRLRQQVGEALYTAVYLPTLLLLVAAEESVTITQIQEWGVARESIQLALIDLRHFLHSHRKPPVSDPKSPASIGTSAAPSAQDERVYLEVAHQGFIRFAKADRELTPLLSEAHATIARAARVRVEQQELDDTDYQETHALRKCLTHLIAAGQNVEATELLDDERFMRRHVSCCLQSLGSPIGLGLRFGVELLTALEVMVLNADSAATIPAASLMGWLRHSYRKIAPYITGVDVALMEAELFGTFDTRGARLGSLRIKDVRLLPDALSEKKTRVRIDPRSNSPLLDSLVQTQALSTGRVFHFSAYLSVSSEEQWRQPWMLAALPQLATSMGRGTNRGAGRVQTRLVEYEVVKVASQNGL